MDSQVIFSLKYPFVTTEGIPLKSLRGKGGNLENFSKGACDSQGQFIFLYEILGFEKEFATKSPESGGDFENSRG